MGKKRNERDGDSSESEYEKKRNDRRSRSRSHGKRDKRTHHTEEKRRKDDSSDDEKPKRRYKEEKPIDEAMMMRTMGFASFDSTKGKDHTESSVHGLKKTTRRQYRQYMNRRGGFNRPLES